MLPTDLTSDIFEGIMVLALYAPNFLPKESELYKWRLSRAVPHSTPANTAEHPHLQQRGSCSSPQLLSKFF